MTTDQRADRTAARHRLVVAVDGPSSSGKSTVGAEAARRLGYRFCDTGLLYRAVAWLAVERGISPDQTAGAGPAGGRGGARRRQRAAGCATWRPQVAT